MKLNSYVHEQGVSSLLGILLASKENVLTLLRYGIIVQDRKMKKTFKEMGFKIIGNKMQDVVMRNVK